MTSWLTVRCSTMSHAGLAPVFLILSCLRLLSGKWSRCRFCRADGRNRWKCAGPSPTRAAPHCDQTLSFVWGLGSGGWTPVQWEGEEAFRGSGLCPSSRPPDLPRGLLGPVQPGLQSCSPAPLRVTWEPVCWQRCSQKAWEHPHFSGALWGANNKQGDPLPSPGDPPTGLETGREH